MNTAAKVSAKAFLYERVKNKLAFHGSETYPVHIRLTVGARSLSFKSWLFYHLKNEKYNDDFFTVADVLRSETELLQWLVGRAGPETRPEQLKTQYLHYSSDLLSIADQQFWKFMADFFAAESLPAYVDLLNSQAGKHNSAFILANLERSLHPVVYHRLEELAVTNAPPYIPLLQYFRQHIKTSLPVLPLWRWQNKQVQEGFQRFVSTAYPQYLVTKPVQLMSAMVKAEAFQSF